MFGIHMSEWKTLPGNSTSDAVLLIPLIRTNVCPKEVSIIFVSEATGHPMARWS
jgi:hypothetical protein